MDRAVQPIYNVWAGTNSRVSVESKWKKGHTHTQCLIASDHEQIMNRVAEVEVVLTTTH